MIEIPLWWWLAPVGALTALAAALLFFRQMLAASPGDDRMREIAGHVRVGAFAYLRRQNGLVAVVFVALAGLLALQAFVLEQQHRLVPFAFLTGGFFSALCGYWGMNTATLASSRTTQGAKESLNRGLQVAFRAGAVMGLMVVGLGLLNIAAWFWALAWLLPRTIDDFRMSLEQITAVMLTFGIGASTQALFARVGGGIFTKAADVGADLVGKVEAGIPEDDPRNPAVIADNVGDNVGDVAGMGADLYESYCGSILATAALGAAAALGLRSAAGGDLSEADAARAQVQLVTAPMILAGLGILLSIAGIFLVRTREGASQMDLLWALRRGIYGSSAMIVLSALVICWLILPASIWFGVFLAIAVGLGVGVAIGYFTEYYTAAEFGPTKWIAEQTVTGPATTIIAGVAQGMLSTWPSITIVGLGTALAYFLAGGGENPSLGLYGIGFAAVGMLATLGITLATDAYGPIADNAGGNAEMTHQPPEVRERTDALDSLGNTTAATGKGFAIGSAALTALALLAAFVEEVRIGIQREGRSFVEARDDAPEGQIAPIGHGKYVMKLAAPDVETGFYPTFIESDGGVPYVADGGAIRRATDREIVGQYDPDVAVVNPVFGLVQVHEATLPQMMGYYGVDLMNPKLLVGVFAGVLMVFVFCGLTMKAVGRAASAMVEEVRRQFRELHLLTDPDAVADYARCVSIATAGAQREMIVPALLAVAAPAVVGLILGVAGLMGLLAGALTSGFAVATFMANAGGAWDNAKKSIEAGHLGGKGSEPHKAAVVGDTVGDPFKDTSGPSLNILIKLMSMVAIVFAGVIVKYGPSIGEALGIGR